MEKLGTVSVSGINKKNAGTSKKLRGPFLNYCGGQKEAIGTTL